MKEAQKQPFRMLSIIRTVILSLVTSCMFATFLIFFSFYRKLVDIYLKVRIGPIYGGLMSTEDSMFFIPTVSKIFVGNVVYVKSNKPVDVLTLLKKVIKEKVFDNPDNYPKLTSTAHQFGGYVYTKKYQCNENDAVKTIEISDRQEFTDDFVKKYTSKLISTKFGKNDTMLWEVHIGTRPLVSDRRDTKTYTYVMIARFHHAISDGTSLLSWLIQLCGDKSAQSYCSDIFKKLKKPEKKLNGYTEWIKYKLENFKKFTIMYLEIVFLSFGRLTEANQLKQKDTHALQAEKYKEDKICVWAIEDKIECVPLVKKIKNRENTTFNCVVFTAIAASLSAYFRRNGFPIPNSISGVIMYLPDWPDEDLSKPIALRNKSGSFIFELPMMTGSTTLLQGMKNIWKESKKQLRATDAALSTFIMHNIAHMPLPVARLFYGHKSQNLLITNVPGGSKITALGEYVFEHAVPVAPNFQGVGVSFAILTYDEKFHITLTIDQELSKSQEEIQKIVDDVPLSIKLLESETKSLDEPQKQPYRMLSIFRTVILSVSSSFMFGTLLIFFSFYRKLVDIYLKRRIGASYGGLMSIEDTMFFVPSVSKIFLGNVVYVKSNKPIDALGLVKNIIKEKVFDNPDNYPKLTSTAHQFGGYVYTKKYQCNENDAVKTIEVSDREEFTENFVKKYTSKLISTEFGKNDTMLWEVHVGTRPLVSDKFDKNTYMYVIIARFHHAIGDATSLLNWLVQMCGDKSAQSYCSDIFKKLKKPEKKPNGCIDWIKYKIENFKKHTLMCLEILFLSFGRLTEENQLKEKGIHALQADNYIEDKICVWAIEDKVECIPLVKKIKNRENITFTCVVTTAVAASLSAYFRRNSFPTPNSISGVLTYLPNWPDEDTSKPIPLRNRSGTFLFDVPMLSSSTTLLQGRQNVWRESIRQLHATDAMLSTLIMHHIARIPLPVARLLYGHFSQNLLITNIPGGSKITALGEYVFEHVIPVAPNFQGVGVTFAILTYDGKFHISLTVDQELEKSETEIQKIADDVLLYIKLMESEIENL
ncbi:uncharacterized protein LOC126746589 [Anthonomus grandis grandis]|uniref:uncharacterized protein LOC126746589 n=1 Tax=Anthonomus grandis grandis TaxID=2921223 RepID=UPI002165DB3C|nr:uncharacterized protein LOC126746589 [Anthonomus grandis grandis]